MSLELFHRYAPAIGALPEAAAYTKEQLLTSVFRMDRDERTEMYYAPHNELPGSERTQVVIVGITPGWTQMERAYRVTRAGLAAGLEPERICRQAKEAARFAGSMRRNLIEMLDALGLPGFLSLASAGELFAEGEERLHTTAALPFPVFSADGRNYSGHAPELLRSAFLREFALRSLREELAAVVGALLIPLGLTVEGCLGLLVEEGTIRPEQVLWGFPHPSGANGHRHKQFEQGRERMTAALRRFWEK